MKDMSPNKAEFRRESILECAIDLLVDGGVEAVTMPRLSQCTGLSRPGIYQYFSSREDILGEILINDMADLSNEIDRILAPIADPDEQIRVWIHYALAHVASPQHRMIREISMQLLPEEKRAELRAMHGYFLSTLISPLTKLGVTNPTAVCNMIFGVISAAAKRISQGATFTEEASTLERFVIAGIEAAQ
ncbi:AcrR family transcriptional regulator [Aurantimicrobium minutum]|nr:AcrR family transcriptional regulator [Aurantimicrobium minutum]